MAEGGGACGGTHGGSSGGDLTVKVWARGLWHWLGVRGAAVDRRAALGGGGWTRCSP
jgi:hypothetical protein